MKNTLTMGYVLRKNNNSKSSVVNRWFAHVATSVDEIN